MPRSARITESVFAPHIPCPATPITIPIKVSEIPKNTVLKKLLLPADLSPSFLAATAETFEPICSLTARITESSFIPQERQNLRSDVIGCPQFGQCIRFFALNKYA